MNQWEFCSGKSTVQALLTATNDWLEMMESGTEAAAVFFDFTKAFYSVRYKVLIKKMDWMSALYSGLLTTSQTVCNML